MSSFTSSLPTLPARAAYALVQNPARRNALSLSVLRSLRSQLVQHNTSTRSGRLLLLPPFRADILHQLERGGLGAVSPHSSPNAYEASFRGDTGAAEGQDYSWLVNTARWIEERQGLPSCIVLRTSNEVPVFSSGHDLGELKSLSEASETDKIRETFALCAEVMTLIRRSPAPVVSVVHGLATAAGSQLALTGDFVISGAATKFMLPGAKIGLPCTSPATIAARRLGHPQTYRLMAMPSESIRADQLSNGAVDIVPEPVSAATSDKAELERQRSEALESRVEQVVHQLADGTPGMPQALSKWAFWTQIGLRGDKPGGDGYEEALEWTGRVMALHARAEDAVEGMDAFLNKRKPQWKT